MKNIYLLLLMFTGILGAQIVNIPDAAFKAILLSANSTNHIANSGFQYVSIDTNGDGEIQNTEADVPVAQRKYIIIFLQIFLPICIFNPCKEEKNSHQKCSTKFIYRT